MNEVRLPYTYAADPTRGRPIFNGSIYIGQPDLDPEIPANQIPVSVRQEDGTEVAVTQPISTSAGGVPQYNGSPAVILVDANVFSFKLLDHLGAQVYYQERATTTPTPPTGVGDVFNVPTIADMKDLVGLADGTRVFPEEYEAGDEAQIDARVFVVDAAPPADNGGSVIRDNAGVGYFKKNRYLVTSVRDWGARGSILVDTDAFKRAIDYLSANVSHRGGTLYMPYGRYLLNDTLTYLSYVVDNAINIKVVGEGWLSTWLDFSAMVGGKDGLYIPNDQQINFSGFYLLGGAGTRDGFKFGSTAGGANAVSVFDVSDVRVQAWGRDGVNHYNSYMGTMQRVYCIANGRDGFHGDGFHTSLSHKNCYARANVAAGFNYAGIVYSSFDTCGSDANQFGYVIANARGVNYKSCGAEGNNQDGWLAFADNVGAPTSNPLFVQECYDVHGVTLDNCSGYGNNILNAGYGGLIRTSATGVHSGPGTFNNGAPHEVFVSVNDCDANVSVPGTAAVVTSQSGGGRTEVILDGNNYMPGGFTKGAGTKIRNRSLSGKRCTLTLSADLTVTTAVVTTVSWGVADDEIGAWNVGTPTRITVPAGVSKIKLTAAMGWVNNINGQRRLDVRKGAGLTYAGGQPRDDRSAAGNFNTTAVVTGQPIDVTPGDYFQLQVEQTSGGNLDLRANTALLAMEVVE